MTAVHPPNSDPTREARPSSSHSNPGNPAFHFPRSGLGTPNWLDFGSGLGSAGGGAAAAAAGGTAAATAATATGTAGGGGMTTPSWFKGATSHSNSNSNNNSNASWKRDECSDDADSSSNEENRPIHPASSSTGDNRHLHSNSILLTQNQINRQQQQQQGHSQPQGQQQPQQQQHLTANSRSNSKGDGSSEDASRTIRALSDPPVRQTPTWIVPKNKLDQEPNPFEYSFSGKPINNSTQYEMTGSNTYQINRRARSTSPKSSHGGAAAAAFMMGDPSGLPGGATQGLGGAGTGSNIKKLQPFGTPSADFSPFGWALDGGAKNAGIAGGGPLSPSMLNGPSYNGGSMFDPSSIRTGLTPGGAGHANNPPHSPATQALFAMMTNATPGLPKIESYDSDYIANRENESVRRSPPNQNPSQPNHPNHNNHPYHPSGLSRPLLGSQPNSSGSGSSSASPFGGDSQGPGRSRFSMTGPPPPGAANQFRTGPPPGPMQQHQPGPLMQNMPRPLPPQAFNSGSNPNMRPMPHGAPHPPPPPRGGAPSFMSNDSNPLYLLSQAQAAMNTDGVPLPPNAAPNMTNPPGGNDDLMAAAALSGLSNSPRPAYVGGPTPMSSIAPGTILPTGPSGMALKPPTPPNNINSGHSQNTQQQQQQPPNGKAGNAPSNKGKKGEQPGDLAPSVPSTGTKRKKGGAAAAPSTGPPSPAKDEQPSKKTKRGGKKSAVPSAPLSAASEPTSPAQDDGRRNGMDSDDDELDEDGEDQGQDENGNPHPPKNRGGRGPKQQFETEEEKRKNFLERNRQAALKCRQRKKQWLQELQSKVEYLTTDNETLTSTIQQLREEIGTLRSILMSHKDCQLPNPVAGPGGPQPPPGPGMMHHPPGGPAPPHHANPMHCPPGPPMHHPQHYPHAPHQGPPY